MLFNNRILVVVVTVVKFISVVLVVSGLTLLIDTPVPVQIAVGILSICR